MEKILNQIKFVHLFITPRLWLAQKLIISG